VKALPPLMLGRRVAASSLLKRHLQAVPIGSFLRDRMLRNGEGARRHGLVSHCIGSHRGRGTKCENVIAYERCLFFTSSSGSHSFERFVRPAANLSSPASGGSRPVRSHDGPHGGHILYTQHIRTRFRIRALPSVHGEYRSFPRK